MTAACKDFPWIYHTLRVQHAAPAANARIAFNLGTGPAVNGPPRFLVFTMQAAQRAGLFDTDPLARRLSYGELTMRAQGVVADMAAAQAQATELGGAVVRTPGSLEHPAGQLLWLDAEGRDTVLDAAIAREEKRYADERVARRGEVS